MHRSAIDHVEQRPPVKASRWVPVFALTLVVTLLVTAAPAGAIDGPASCNANDNGIKWGVTWTAVAAPVDDYVIQRSLDGGQTWTRRHVEQAAGSDLQYGESDNAAGARYRIRTRTSDPAATSSATACTVNGNPPAGPDTSRPATPKRPSVSGQADGSVTLALEHRGDDVGVATFHLYRNTVNDFSSAVAVGYPADANPRTVTQSGLAGGTYFYWLKVSDAAGNRSWRSGAREITVEASPPAEPDTTRPATPKRPGIASQADASVTLSLEHRGDDVGVATFHLYRNTVNDFSSAAAIDYPATANPRTVTQSGLTAGTHFYWLKVSDAAGNRSWRSGAREVTVTDDNVFVDPIPAAAKVDWQNTGVVGGVDSTGDGPTIALSPSGDDAVQIQAALDDLATLGGGTVQLTGGRFLLDDRLFWGSGHDGVVLRGAANGSTVLEFSSALPSSRAIQFQGGYGIAPIPAGNGPGGLRVTGGSEGSTSLTVSRGGFTTDEIVSALDQQYLWLDHRPGGSVAGQVVYVETATPSGNGVSFTLRDELEDDMVGAYVRPLDMVERSGIADLRLEFTAAGHQLGQPAVSGSLQHAIELKFTAEAFVADVTSGTSNAGLSLAGRRGQWGAHVLVNASYRCTVQDSDFVDAALHGDGGQGYGVSFSNNPTRCRIENNTFERLRHAILLQEGATANVIAFNYSRDPFHTNYKNGGPADMSFHSYATANLVEGNVVERIHTNDTATSGERNVIFRNCLYTGPLTLERSQQNYFVGNAMYGTNARLRNRTMPASTGGDNQLVGNATATTGARPYRFGSVVFDDDGIYEIASGPVNSGNLVFGNWYQGNRPAGENGSLPGSYYGAAQSPMLSNPTGQVTQTCRNAATNRAGDLAAAVNGRQG